MCIYSPVLSEDGQKSEEKEHWFFLKLEKEKSVSRSFSTIFTLDLGIKKLIVAIIYINTLNIY